MKIDIHKLSDELARDDTITDYDFWRALKILENEFFKLEKSGDPIPMKIIQQRKIIRSARQKRASRSFG